MHGPRIKWYFNILNRIKMSFIDENPYDWVAIKNRIFTDAYIVKCTWTMRAYNQMMAGFDFAILDLIGKFDNRPIHQILGGAHRNKVGYFFFYREVPQKKFRNTQRRDLQRVNASLLESRAGSN